jgi:hypothetical protein
VLLLVTEELVHGDAGRRAAAVAPAAARSADGRWPPIFWAAAM